MTTTSVKVSELTGDILDCILAEALGYRFWLEQRGEYRLAVMAEPGEREPWQATKSKDSERYTPCSAIEARRTGFFGRGMPRFTRDWSQLGPIKQRFRVDTEYLEGAVACSIYTADPNTVEVIAEGEGPDELIAACRAIATSYWGEYADIPSELVGSD